MTSPHAYMSSFALRQGNSFVLNVSIVFLGALLISLLAQVSFPLPFTPVPITGQTFAVALLSLLWGQKRALATTVFYISLGGIGFPVFAQAQSGFLLGPTFGYLLGMMVASYVMGMISDTQKINSFGRALFATYVGSAITFSFGLIGLSFFVPLKALLFAGLFPFLPGDLFKNILVSVLVSKFYRQVKV